MAVVIACAIDRRRRPTGRVVGMWRQTLKKHQAKQQEQQRQEERDQDMEARGEERTEKAVG